MKIIVRVFFIQSIQLNFILCHILTIFVAKRKKKRKKKKSESEASDNEEKEEIDDTDETADVNVEEKLGHTQDLSEKCILFSIFSFILMLNQILSQFYFSARFCCKSQYFIRHKIFIVGRKSL